MADRTESTADFDSCNPECFNAGQHTLRWGDCQQVTPPADAPTTEDLVSADNPTHLRWGLGDVLHGDDGTVIVMMSGLDREPYWLELDPPQAAVLREDLAGPATTHPASHCPRAAHTLQWGLHPDSTTQGWILRHQHDDDGSSLVAVLDGYPNGRTPILADEARAWADRILGTAHEWVEQPARSGAYHQHNTEKQDAPKVEPHPTEADLRHALTVLARFEGRDTDVPAVVAEPGKEA